MPLGFKVQWQYWVHDRILIWLKLMYVFPCLLRFIRNVTLSILRRKLTCLHISTKMNWHWQQKLLVGAHVFKVHAIGEESLGTPVCSAIYVRILIVGLLLELQTICCWCCWCCHCHLSLLVTHWGTCWENWVEDEQWGMVKAPAISSTYCWLCALGLSSGWVLQDEVFIDTIATLGWGQRITRRMLQHGPHDMDVIVLAQADIIIQLPHTSP
jgi:hypothetical protein